MPNVTAAGTYTYQDAGFGALINTPFERVLLFAGTSLGTSCQVQYLDDQGVARTFANGNITVLPTSIAVRAPGNIYITVTGTPDFNVTILKRTNDKFY